MVSSAAPIAVCPCKFKLVLAAKLSCTLLSKLAMVAAVVTTPLVTARLPVLFRMLVVMLVAEEVVAAEAMVKENALLYVVGALSVTCTEKVKVPVAVGVPVIVPLEPRVSPSGKAPDPERMAKV